MIIIIPISEFSRELFPNIDTDKDTVINELEKYYTIGSKVPEIKFENNSIIIKINTDNLEAEQRKYNSLITLCEKGEFEKALPLAQELVSSSPAHSEYHRILGQIYSELSNTEESINSLIDSLKWNPTNIYALIMVGNVFLRFKDDINTAMIYYNEVLRINPKDFITLNNIGATLLQLKKNEEAKEYFKKAVYENPEYPNTYFGLALVTKNENNLNDAFDYALKALNLSKSKDEIYNNSLSLIGEIVKILSESKSVLKILNNHIGELESKFNSNIKIEEDTTLLTSAKIEIRENYNRDYHLIKYKSDSPAYPHLVLHELLHLELIEEAKKVGKNSLFISNNAHKSKFFYIQNDFIDKMKSKGIDGENINRYMEALFNGINLQVFNAPIDLFIEDLIYSRFKVFKPIQFYSLFILISEGIEATTNIDIVENSPKDILSVSKIYNLTLALHFRKLFGVDLTKTFNASINELNTANKFYEEFLEYSKDKAPSEEYELVQHWADDLKMDSFFELINENKYRNQTIDNVIESINKDPYNLEETDGSKDRQMRLFIENHANKDVNFAVTMYMSEAIPFIKNLEKDKQKKIAFEFATLGMTGINPDKDNYTIPSIPDRKFTGYQALAYYYVSWAIGIPEMLEQLQMPFNREFDIANQFNSL